MIVNRLRRHVGQMLRVGPGQDFDRIALHAHPVQAGIGNLALARPRQRQGTRRAVNHVQHSAMRHHHQRLLRMGQHQAAQGGQHAGVKLARALAAGKSVVGLKPCPLRSGIGMLGLDVFHPHAIDHTKMLFPQVGGE